MQFKGKINALGTGLEMEDRFKIWALKNKGERIFLEPLLPESRKQRSFYHGAVIVLWAYLNDLDYKDTDTLRWLHEEAKKEFNGHMIVLDGQKKIMGRSTKGVLGEHTNKVIDFLEEQYGIDRTKCLNPKDYKYFMDVIFSDGQYDDYIDYLKELKQLPVK